MELPSKATKEGTSRNVAISYLFFFFLLPSHVQKLQREVIDFNIKLVIIDSIAALARTEFGAQSIAERQRMLGRQASQLKYIAEAFTIPVLVTNQVTTAMGGRGAGAGNGQGEGHLMAALGPMWAHAVNTRLVMAAQKGKGVPV